MIENFRTLSYEKADALITMSEALKNDLGMWCLFLTLYQNYAIINKRSDVK